MMKQLLIAACLLTTLTAHAQSNGYYRLKNKATGEYATLASDVLSYNTVLYDIGASGLIYIKVWGVVIAGNERYQYGRETAVAKVGCYLQHDIRLTEVPGSNAASVFYIKKNSGSEYDLLSEGSSLHTITKGTYTGGSVDVDFDGYYTTIESVSGKSGVYTMYIPVKGKAMGFSVDMGNYYFKASNGIFGVEKDASSKDYAQWYLEPATTFNVAPLSKVKDGNGHWWTTLCVDFPFSIPATGSTVVAAYTITGKDSEGYAVLNQLQGTIPGGTPVLIECASDNSETNILNIETSQEPAGVSCADGEVITTSGNYLQGRYFNAPSASYQYLNTYKSPSVTESLGTEANVLKNDKTNYRVLNIVDGQVGFYKLANANATMGANKAFLNINGLPTVAQTSAKVFAMEDDGDLSGIRQATTNGDAPKVIYDMQGRRVTNPTSHGIYIVNGKKVVF